MEECKIVHNTVHDPDNRLGRLIRLVHDNDGLVVANNLLSGPPVRNESPSPVQLLDNLSVRDYSHAFANAARGNLHLTSKAVETIDRAVPSPDATDDIDREKRTGKPDIGADEFQGSS